MMDAVLAVSRKRLALLPTATRLEPAELLTRDAPGGLKPPEHRSANRKCRLIEARDGWFALNLARADDRDLIPALTGCDPAVGAQEAVEAAARNQSARDFVERGIELQLPVALPGEAHPLALTTTAVLPPPGLRVLDLSALWAGPLITSARAPALARLGLSPADHPDLVWIAITAHGWDSHRVGFGDDCAIAGGLVREGPRFLGDALADPLTGLEGALAALDRVARGEGGLIDLPLARVAVTYAGYARLHRKLGNLTQTPSG